LYVGGISRYVKLNEIEDMFGEFGKVKDINLKGRYAFVVSTSLFLSSLIHVFVKEYQDYRDARAAIDKLHDSKPFKDGGRLQVEATHRYSGGERREDRRRAPSPTTRCFNCNKTGHW
jgi:arginine/serine-rich splicing factor 7